MAIEIPPPARKVIAAVQRRFEPLDLKASWVRPENVHLTLKFLGNIHPDRVPEIGRVLSEAAGEIQPFPLALSGVGLFPKKGNPRVLWVGVRDPGRCLDRLHRRVESGLQSLGFELENRPFSPHLTVARIKSPKNARELRGQVEAGPELPHAEFEVGRMALFQSELTPAGSRYSILKEIPLDLDGPETSSNSKKEGEDNGR